jgi:hypothetical protein
MRRAFVQEAAIAERDSGDVLGMQDRAFKRADRF